MPLRGRGNEGIIHHTSSLGAMSSGAAYRDPPRLWCWGILGLPLNLSLSEMNTRFSWERSLSGKEIHDRALENTWKRRYIKALTRDSKKFRGWQAECLLWRWQQLKIPWWIFLPIRKESHEKQLVGKVGRENISFSKLQRLTCYIFLSCTLEKDIRFCFLERRW